VVAARRTPFGAVHGLLSGWHPVDLLAHTLSVTLDDAGLTGGDVDAVLVGCAHPVGAQSANVARAAVLAAGWPDTIPATTVERGAGSSHRALQLASHTIAAGAADVVVVGGVEVMSLVPAGAPGLNRQYGAIWGAGPAGRYAAEGGLVPSGVAGDRLAAGAGIDRAEQDAEAARGRDRATAAGHLPWLVMTPVNCNDRDRPRAALAVMVDDEIPPQAVDDDQAPMHDDEGTVAASNIAPAADGAAVAVLASTTWLSERGRSAPSCMRGGAEAATSPVTVFGAGPDAARRALEQAGVAVGELVGAELDGPHAAAVLHLRRAIGLDEEIANRVGGSLGRGRPLGAVGVAMLADGLGPTSVQPGPVLLVDESDDGTATATVVGPA